jgi:hypothetical protein
VRVFEDDNGQLSIFQERERVRDRRRQVANLLSLAGMAVVVAAIPGILTLQMVLTERAERRAWTIEGPACPVVARPSPMGSRRRGDPMSHDYGGSTFTRSFGAVSCAGFREPALFEESRVYHVCQFNNPGAVVVRTPAETKTFEGPPGRRLTVTVREGRASCVVGGWFSLH